MSRRGSRLLPSDEDDKALDVLEESLEDLQRSALRAQRRYYDLRVQRDRDANKTCTQKCDSMMSFKYLKQFWPSLVLLVVGIVGFVLASIAQQKIAELNSVVNSVNDNSDRLSFTLGELQAKSDELENHLSADQQQFQVLEQQVNNTVATVTQQATVVLQQANGTLADAVQTLQMAQQMQSATQNYSTAVLNEIQQINASYPYPWVVQQQVQDLQERVQMLLQQISTKAPNPVALVSVLFGNAPSAVDIQTALGAGAQAFGLWLIYAQVWLGGVNEDESYYTVYLWQYHHGNAQTPPGTLTQISASASIPQNDNGGITSSGTEVTIFWGGVRCGSIYAVPIQFGI